MRPTPLTPPLTDSASRPNPYRRVFVLFNPVSGTDQAADIRQAAVVMAGMLLQAANSDKELPRPPLPTRPTPTDPFKYEYPPKP